MSNRPATPGTATAAATVQQSCTAAAKALAGISPAAIIATIKINLLRRPLWESHTVQDCLDIKRDRLIEMIEAGELAWAWNIGLGGNRREVRVLGHCVVERQTGVIPQIGATRNLKLAEVVDLILPRVRQTLRGRELQSLFLCNPDAIRQLRMAGELDLVAETLPKHGPNASRHYTRESLVKFLERRRIT